MINDLKVLNGELTPKYDIYNNHYTVKITNDIDKLDLSFTSNNDDEVLVYGNENLKVGENSIIIAITNNNETNYVFINAIKEGKTTEVMNIMDNNIKTENNSSLVYGGPLIIISCIMLILTLFVWMFKYKKN